MLTNIFFKRLAISFFKQMNSGVWGMSWVLTSPRIPVKGDQKSPDGAYRHEHLYSYLAYGKPFKPLGIPYLVGKISRSIFFSSSQMAE